MPLAMPFVKMFGFEYTKFDLQYDVHTLAI